MSNFDTQPIAASNSLVRRTLYLSGLIVAALLVPTFLAAADAPPAMPDAVEPAAEALEQQDEFSPVEPVIATPVPVAQALIAEALPVAVPIACRCMRTQVTDPVTRVGATCLKARQKAAAAARERASCTTGICTISHSVAPCQPITNGYSATAVATFSCKNPKFC